MVLYYNIKRPDNDSREAVEDSHESVTQMHSPAARIIPMEPTIKDENLADRFSTLIAGGHPEFLYSLMEDDFKDLSVDDKLLVMHKTAILRSSITNNYILMCLALLVIITVKVFSK